MKQPRMPHRNFPLAGSPSGTATGTSTEQVAAQWIALCEQRLAELSPGGDRHALHDIAVEMHAELPHFDPVMAAEMEHEGGMLQD